MWRLSGRTCRPSLTRAALIVVAALAAAFPEHALSAYTDGNRTVRKYSISADKVWWDYAPLGLDGCSGLSWDDGASVFTVSGIGSKYLKAVFREYDSNFTAPKVRTAEDMHLGLMGPIIRATVGDVIELQLRNNLNFPINMQPSGVSFALQDGEPVDPGNITTLRWVVGEQAGPGVGEASSKLWLYRSTLDVVGHANAGLVGPIIVSRRDSAAPDGRPVDVDRELVTLFHVTNENESPLLPETLAALNASDGTMGLSHEDFEESNMMHGINGLVFCNLRGLNASQGDRLRWHVAVEGNEVDLHNTHWHGNVLNLRGAHVDQFSLLPGRVVTSDMITDNPGTWLLHCHVNDHIHAGMKATYYLDGQANKSYSLPGEKLEYYIAAEEVLWEYTPMNKDMCSTPSGELPLIANMMPNGTRGPGGPQRVKAQYVAYTDATFTERRVRSPASMYLGNLGPLLRATVGDTIVIHFLNKLEYNTSMHAHGVFYHKDSEGSPYADGTSGADKLDEKVPPGGNHTYTWFVPERAGPGPSDPSSVMWMYHSHSDEIADTLAGLLGPIIVTRKDMATVDHRPKDVDREFVLALNIMDEGASFYSRANLKRLHGRGHGGEHGGDDDDDGLPTEDDPGFQRFQEANKFHSINGYLFCNGPPMQAVVGEKLRFYTLSLGTEDGLHTPALVASDLRSQGNAHQAILLLPGSMHTSDAVVSTPGDFLLQCRVDDHQRKGMRALLHVAPAQPGALALPPAGSGATRSFFIAAEPITWDYAPGGNLTNQCTGEPYTEEELVFILPGNGTLGSQYTKAVYSGYQDATFTKRAPQNPAHGILGPLMYAEVGDTLLITFKNSLPFAANIQMGGGLLSPNSTQYTDAVPPNATVVYRFVVAEDAGPGVDDMSTVAYTYTSSVHPVAHSNAGLVGVYYIGRRGSLNLNGVPKGVDNVIPLLFTIFKELQSSFAADNLGIDTLSLDNGPGGDRERDGGVMHGRDGGVMHPRDGGVMHGHHGLEMEITDYDIDSEDAEAIEEPNLKHSINGFLFCNGPTLVVPEGRPIRYLLVGFGGQLDMHTPVFTNQVLVRSGRPSYAVDVVPAVAVTADMRAGGSGTWLYHCNVQDHILAGMVGRFTVQPAGTVTSSSINAQDGP